MKQFVLDHMIAECKRSERVKQYRVAVPDADMRIDLDNGKTLAVYVINRAIRIPEIKERYEENTKKRVHTLFLIDGRMMPPDNSELEPPHWLSTLHQVGNGRVYGYWLDGRSVCIRPVHMDWKWGNSPRSVAYGPEIDLHNLRGELSYSSGKFITGYYATADFGEGNFWKKHEPIEDLTQKYSWRQWNYSSKQRAQAQNNEQDGWDAWEDFQRNYGEVGDKGAGGEDQDFWRSTSRRKRERAWNSGNRGERGSSQQRGRVRVVSKINPYVVLGIAYTASDDEIKQAYRRKAREYHPDLHPAEEKEKFTAKMADINAAFELLTKRRNE